MTHITCFDVVNGVNGTNVVNGTQDMHAKSSTFHLQGLSDLNDESSTITKDWQSETTLYLDYDTFIIV